MILQVVIVCGQEALSPLLLVYQPELAESLHGCVRKNGLNALAQCTAVQIEKLR